jgi:sugar/nucleoside kinase (ribokinase family)
MDDVTRIPIGEGAIFRFAATNLSREPSRSATRAAAEMARRNGTILLFWFSRHDCLYSSCCIL